MGRFQFAALALVLVITSAPLAFAKTNMTHAEKYACLSSIRVDEGLVTQGPLGKYDGSQASISAPENTFTVFTLGRESQIYVATARGLRSCEVSDDNVQVSFEVAPGVNKTMTVLGSGARVKTRLDDAPLKQANGKTEIYKIDCVDILDNSKPNSALDLIIREQLKNSAQNVRKRIESLTAKSKSKLSIVEAKAVLEGYERSIKNCEGVLTKGELNAADKELRNMEKEFNISLKTQNPAPRGNGNNQNRTRVTE